MSLPPNWNKYTTDDGKEYYHDSATNTTQWERPAWAGSGIPESLSFHSQSSDVYRPNVSDLDLNERQSDVEGRTVPMSTGQGVDVGSEARGGKLPTVEAETVSLGSVPTGSMDSRAGSSTGASPSFLGLGSMLASAAAGSEESAAGVQGWAGGMLTYAQSLFDISSDEVLQRLKLALVPFKGQEDASRDFRTRPDFYGPFWVATTAVLFLAGTGNFARLLEMKDESSFKADYSLVSVAATMIYGLLVGVPLIIRMGLWWSGLEVDSINFKQVICVYGYSLTPTVPMSIVCLVPIALVRWLAVMLGLGASLTFIRDTLWTDLAVEAPSLKWKVVGVFCTAQATVFLVYRIYFFHSI
eukprot:TRINITY_DN14533_c0_g1_i3.p1 TRINITY_DN14533_c0_g1~~TRINITY_DN14533_c0_g1_i3.p1  ORF type:complete len:355 (+),score=62.86 TRINITY_DN14533_c0_g1_i3:137-1201(+)